MLFAQVTLVALSAIAASHPVHDEREHLQVVKTAHVSRANKDRTLEACASQLEAQGVHARAMERRNAMFDAYRAAMGIPLDTPCMMSNDIMMKRNTCEPLGTDHQVHLDASEVMGNDPGECWDPRVCPYPSPSPGKFCIPGEHFRGELCASEKDVPGIFVVADIQLINVETCEPMADVWADVWSCNATGLHSGMHPDTNEDEAIVGTFNYTVLHGLHKSDVDGVFHFQHTIPIHQARTNHQHIVVHQNATILPDGTLASGRSVSHIVQLFWDQALMDEMENAGPRTSDSGGLVFGGGLNYSYALFGEDVNSGILAWAVVGVDPPHSYTSMSSSAPIEGGGVAVGGKDVGGWFY